MNMTPARRVWVNLFLLGLIVGVCVAAPALVGAQTRPEPDALARALQQRYQGIRDFSADFVHSYRGGVLKTRTEEHGSGHGEEAKPYALDLHDSRKKEFVSDGVKIYSYIPEDRQVIVSNVPPDDQATTPALFLAGKGDIARDFSASYVDSTVPGTLALKLVPKRSQPDYEYLIVAVDPATTQMRGLTTHDRQGGDSTLIFSNLKENQGISDKEFAFHIPRGVDVITDASPN